MHIHCAKSESRSIFCRSRILVSYSNIHTTHKECRHMWAITYFARFESSCLVDGGGDHGNDNIAIRTWMKTIAMLFFFIHVVVGFCFSILFFRSIVFFKPTRRMSKREENTTAEKRFTWNFVTTAIVKRFKWHAISIKCRSFAIVGSLVQCSAQCCVYIYRVRTYKWARTFKYLYYIVTFMLSNCHIVHNL